MWREKKNVKIILKWKVVTFPDQNVVVYIECVLIGISEIAYFEQNGFCKLLHGIGEVICEFFCSYGIGKCNLKYIHNSFHFVEVMSVLDILPKTITKYGFHLYNFTK